MSGSDPRRDGGEEAKPGKRRAALRATIPRPVAASSRRSAPTPPNAGRHLRLAQPIGSPEERTALALSILRHRTWHPDDARHVEAVVAALLGASIEELLAGTSG